MDVKFERQDKTLTVFLRGEIDHHAAGGLREQIDGAVVSSGVSCLILDFSEVSFMDSSGIGLILGRYKRMCARGGRLQVCGVNARYLAMMKMAGMEKLGILYTEESATNESDE